MKEITRLTEGTSAALLYDYCCMRGNLFCESHLSNIVGEILQSLHGGKTAQVIAGYQHPILANNKVGSGRRPELDLVVTGYDDSSATVRKRSVDSPVKRARNTSLIVTAIETKWAGSSHCTLSNIVWDLLRLEMLVANNASISAVLLLAGSEKNMDSLRENQGLGYVLPFQPLPHKLELKSKDSRTIELLSPLFQEKKMQKYAFPKAMQLSASTSALECKNKSGMSVIAWQVKSVSKRSTFTPSEIAEYKTPTKSKRTKKAI